MCCNFHLYNPLRDLSQIYMMSGVRSVIRDIGIVCHTSVQEDQSYNILLH